MEDILKHVTLTASLNALSTEQYFCMGVQPCNEMYSIVSLAGSAEIRINRPLLDNEEGVFI